jgi:hypothetical protein
MTAKDVVTELASTLTAELIEAADVQGHRLTGSLAKNIGYEVTGSDNEAEAKIYGPDYAIYLNYGVAPGKVRYPISVMVDFFRKRGLPEKEATRAAWATRAKHKREGMPTKSSARFSRNGKRTGFLQEGFAKGMAKIREKAPGLFDDYVEVLINQRYKTDTVEVVTFAI